MYFKFKKKKKLFRDQFISSNEFFYYYYYYFIFLVNYTNPALEIVIPSKYHDAWI